MCVNCWPVPRCGSWIRLYFVALAESAPESLFRRDGTGETDRAGLRARAIGDRRRDSFGARRSSSSVVMREIIVGHAFAQSAREELMLI